MTNSAKSGPFHPQKGELFYVNIKPRRSQEMVQNMDGSVAVQTLTHQDNSYSEDIFRCKGFDDRMMVAERVVGGYGSSSDKSMLFKKDKYEFFPVGPDVMQVLGIKSTVHTQMEHEQKVGEVDPALAKAMGKDK